MKTILKVENLSKNFGPVKAVNDLSFTIEKGKIYGLLGPNGSGKSTTLGMILGVVNKTDGIIEWFDNQLDIHQALKKTGAIIERPNFYPYMTAKQNLELVCKIKEIPTDDIFEKLELVNLLDRKNDKFKTFSLGMKQRLAIASALLNNPDLLILDEPTNGLDPKGIREIRNIIHNIAKQGTTIILASHLLDEVEKVCNKVIVLQQGKKIYEGDVNNIQKQSYWFEIETDEVEKTIKILNEFTDIDKIENKDGKIRIYTTKLSGKELNKTLASNEIYVESLLKKQLSLEDMFLELTSK